MPVLVGTSGWQYRDWRYVLYPAGLAERDWLEHYASRYATVENNGTFYRLPPPETFAGWRARTPDGFVMTVKASRYLTHVRRPRDPAEPVERLMRAAARLGDRLGPVLLQLPPNLRADPGALDDCLREFARFPGGPDGGRARVAVEPRHESWWTEETRQVLAAHNAALCWADRLGRPLTPLWHTADWGYLRFHEGAAAPWAPVRRPGPARLGRSDRGGVARRRGRVRLLQQRPARRRPVRRGRVRRDRPPVRPPGDRRAGARGLTVPVPPQAGPGTGTRPVAARTCNAGRAKLIGAPMSAPDQAR
jgi:uncharacterized protein YecE (DUF72 family)